MVNSWYYQQEMDRHEKARDDYLHAAVMAEQRAEKVNAKLEYLLTDPDRETSELTDYEVALGETCIEYYVWSAQNVKWAGIHRRKAARFMRKYDRAWRRETRRIDRKDKRDGRNST